MNFMSFLTSIRRRWYIGVAGLLIAAVGAVFVYQAVKPTYERSASELLLPGSQSIPKGGNPYLFLGDVSQATDILVRALGADDVQKPAVEGHPGATVAVARDSTTSGPIVVITTTGKTDADADAVLHGMVTQLRTTLATLQTNAGAKGGQLITSTSLTFDRTSTLNQKTRYTYTGIAAATIVVVTLLTIAFVDGLILGRARRRKAAEEDAPSESKAVLAVVREVSDEGSDRAGELSAGADRSDHARGRKNRANGG